MQQLLRTLSLTLSVGIFGTTAEAQSFGLSFDAEGRLALGYTDRVPGSDAFLFGDTTARLSFDRIPLGIELGVFGLADALDTPHETYGALTWDFTHGGRLSVGVPRPAYDSFAVSALETQFPSLGVARTGATRSLATFGAMFGNFLPYGVRFQNGTNGLRYAASVHTVPNQDLTIAGVGMAWPMGDWVLEGAVEVAYGAATEFAGKVQATGRVGRVSGGVGLYAPGTVGGPEMIEAFAAVEPLDRVAVAGVVQVPLDGSTDPIAGLSARYSIRPGEAVSVGVLSEAGADAAFSAFLDWSF